MVYTKWLYRLTCAKTDGVTSFAIGERRSSDLGPVYLEVLLIPGADRYGKRKCKERYNYEEYARQSRIRSLWIRLFNE
jgi:hypothetical protein